MDDVTVSLAQRIANIYGRKEGHAFGIVGNITDYVMHEGVPTTLRKYLAALLNTRVVVFYNPTEGFTFPFGDNDRDEFVKRSEAGNASPDPVSMIISGVSTESNSDPLDGVTTDEALVLIQKALYAKPGVERDNEGKEIVRRIGVVIFNVDAIASNAPFNQQVMGERLNVVRIAEWGDTSNPIKASDAMVFMVAPNKEDIHARITDPTSRWAIINIPSPNEDERREYIEYLIKKERLILDDSMDSGYMARITPGLLRKDIEDIALRLQKNPADLETIRQLRKERLAQKYDDILQLFDPRWGFEAIAGMKELKALFRKVVMDPINTGNLARMAKGFLFMGPAGVGKTVLAEALAFEAGFNFVVFDPSKVLNMYLGESEKRMRTFLDAIIENSPAIVVIDEADTFFKARGSTRNNDNGVDDKLSQMLMTVMSDKKYRGKIVWILITNYPRKLDPALIRVGRIDFKIFIPLPSVETRIHLLTLGFKGINNTLTKGDYEVAAVALKGYTGAEITEGVVLKAIRLAEDEADRWENAVVSRDDLMNAIKGTRRSTKDVEEMVEQALENVDDLDLLEPEWREMMLKREQNKTGYSPETDTPDRDTGTRRI